MIVIQRYMLRVSFDIVDMFRVQGNKNSLYSFLDYNTPMAYIPLW